MGRGFVLDLTKMMSEGMKEFKEGEWLKLLLLSFLPLDTKGKDEDSTKGARPVGGRWGRE